MKRILSLGVACAMAFSFAAATSTNHVRAADKIKIGLVTDTGKVDDRSFNQSAWEGAQAAAKEVGGEAKYVETVKPEDYGQNISLFAEDGYNVIVTVGFLMGDATAKAAADYPDIHFIAVDQFQGAVIPNVTGLIFPEKKSGFLAGVLAARLSKSGIIAAVLGTDTVPPVVNFKEGYEAGAKYVNKDIKILSTYHDATNAFNDPEWGATTATSALDQGADVVFGAGGKTGNGALEEVAKKTTKDKPLYCIGVDTDQWDTVPAAQPCLVSSAQKLIQPGIVDIVKAIADGTVEGGNFVGKVGLAPYHDFEKIVPADVQKEIIDIAAKLESGEMNDDGSMATPAAMEATMEATAEATAAK